MKLKKTKTIINNHSDPGFARSTNEDFAWSGTNNVLHNMLIVSDGVGSYPGSDVASKMICKTFIKSFLNKDYLKWDINDWFLRTINKSKLEMFEYIQKNRDHKDMSATLVLAIIFKNHIHIFWIGDSRAYFLSLNEARLLTEDHNLYNYLKSINSTDEQIKKYENSLTSITNSIDANFIKHKKYSYICKPFKIDSLFFLASDGFYNFYEMENLFDLIKNSNSNNLSKALVEKAIINGSHDNISFSYIGIFH